MGRSVGKRIRQEERDRKLGREGKEGRNFPPSATHARSGHVPEVRRETPQPSVTQKMRGTVKWFDDRKGYGFIARDDGGKDAFVHFKAIQTTSSFKTLHEGQRVEFILEDSPKGPQAKQVKVIDD